MPGTTWPVSRLLPGSSRGILSTPVLMPPMLFRHVISGSLSLAFSAHTCRAHGATFPATLTTTALDRSSSGRFAAIPLQDGCGGPPDHRAQLLHLRYSSAFDWSDPLHRPLLKRPWHTQNRAPPLELHRKELAGAPARQPRGHHQLDRRDDHRHRSGSRTTRASTRRCRGPAFTATCCIRSPAAGSRPTASLLKVEDAGLREIRFYAVSGAVAKALSAFPATAPERRVFNRHASAHALSAHLLERMNPPAGA